MSFTRDVFVGVLIGWAMSLLALAVMWLRSIDQTDVSTGLVEQLQASLRQDNNGCHECGDTAAVFRCQLFFECALELTQGAALSRVAAQVQSSNLFIFDHVDICGAQLVGGGVFNLRFVTVQPAGCIPAFTANITRWERNAMGMVLSWIQGIASAKPTTMLTPNTGKPLSPTDTSSESSFQTVRLNDHDKPRESARNVAGEFSVRVPLVTGDGSLSAEMIAKGNSDGQVVSVNDNRLVPRGATIVAMDGAPVDANLVLQQAATESGNREVVLVLEFEPTPESVAKRKPDALNIYVPPSMRRQIVPGRLRTPAGYTEWATAMRATDLLPQLQLQFINQPTPLVFSVDNVFDKRTAEEIINLASASFRRATVSDIGRNGNAQHKGRTGEQAWLEPSSILHETTSNAVAHMVELAANMVGLDVSHAEPMQVVRYAQGEEYQMHWDAFQEHTGLGRQEMNNTRVGDAGQRLITVLGYLRAPEGGGVTAFQHLRTTIMPKVGRLVVWHNCYDGTSTMHPDTLHASKPVDGEGEKVVFNIWFRERPVELSVMGAATSQ